MQSGRSEVFVILSEAKNLRIGRQTLMNQYYVHIMTTKSSTLYTGVTNNLERRHSKQA